MTIPLDTVVGLNQPAVVYTGALQAGFSQTTGNSHLRNASLLGELSARSESLRLTILGRYVYGDDRNNIIVRNSRGTIKLDFFLTKRLYWFASAYFEQDTFQDLKLRTSLATGPGYQLLDRGDLRGIFKDMTLWAEAAPLISTKTSRPPTTRPAPVDDGPSNGIGPCGAATKSTSTTFRKGSNRCRMRATST